MVKSILNESFSITYILCYIYLLMQRYKENPYAVIITFYYYSYTIFRYFPKNCIAKDKYNTAPL